MVHGRECLRMVCYSPFPVGKRPCCTGNLLEQWGEPHPVEAIQSVALEGVLNAPEEGAAALMARLEDMDPAKLQQLLLQGIERGRAGFQKSCWWIWQIFPMGNKR